MPRLELKTILTDDDGMLKIVVGAAGAVASASMEVYSYAAELEAFASRLEDFPMSIADEVVWECGDADPKWFGHMVLRAHVNDGVGHSAIQVHMDARGDPPNRVMSSFFLCCNPADLNELGRRIKAWLPNPSEQLAVEWRDV